MKQIIAVAKGFGFHFIHQDDQCNSESAKDINYCKKEKSKDHKIKYIRCPYAPGISAKPTIYNNALTVALLSE